MTVIVVERYLDCSFVGKFSTNKLKPKYDTLALDDEDDCIHDQCKDEHGDDKHEDGDGDGRHGGSGVSTDGGL